MKRIFVFAFLLIASLALGQDITNHAVPIGGGQGAVGWRAAGPCAAGFALVYTGVTADPVCTSVSGSGSAPGGSSGQIQYNNGGTFGGFAMAGDCTFAVPDITCTKTSGLSFVASATTDTTSASNISSGTLACGRLPALTGVVTTSAGSCATSSTSTLPAGFIAPAVVADGQFIGNGTMTNGGTTLTSASNPFVAGDVGKTVQCGGTGAAGVLQSGTITVFNSAGSVTVSFTAGSNTSSATCQWGTDNTTVINNAIAGLTKGGTVLLPTGYIMVSSINMTNTLSVGMLGAACGINGAGFGTVLVPTTSTATNAMIDLTGAQGPYLECMQINTTRSPVAPGAGILIANTGSALATLVRLKRLFVVGHFRNPALYIYGLQDSSIFESNFWTYDETLFGQSSGGIGVYISRDNARSMASLYTTIATGSQGAGNVSMIEGEIHDFLPGGGATNGVALWLRGAQNVHVQHYLLDSSTALGIVYSEQSTDTTDTNRTTFMSSTFYNENGTTAANCIDIASGSMTNTTIINPSYTCTTTRTGTIGYQGFSTP